MVIFGFSNSLLFEEVPDEDIGLVSSSVMSNKVYLRKGFNGETKSSRKLFGDTEEDIESKYQRWFFFSRIHA